MLARILLNNSRICRGSYADLILFRNENDKKSDRCYQYLRTPVNPKNRGSLRRRSHARLGSRWLFYLAQRAIAL
ncbi:MAG: hypothetical protein F6J93_39085 [Oscillatoria sp. SIO1A7]|nr:hypothetical protein [Oscillatoria sp. SIO1A7]